MKFAKEIAEQPSKNSISIFAIGTISPIRREALAAAPEAAAEAAAPRERTHTAPRACLDPEWLRD